MVRTGKKSRDALMPMDCVSFGLRKASRIATKFYDDALRPSGLRNTQFALLGKLDSLGEASIGDLAEILATDGTTLTRNLEILVRRDLIQNIVADDGRVRNVRLTDLGKRTFAEAVPLWREAQKHVLDALGRTRWKEMRSELRKIEAACDR